MTYKRSVIANSGSRVTGLIYEVAGQVLRIGVRFVDACSYRTTQEFSMSTVEKSKSCFFFHGYRRNEGLFPGEL